MTYTTRDNNGKGQRPQVPRSPKDAQGLGGRKTISVKLRPIKHAHPSAGRNLSTGV